MTHDEFKAWRLARYRTQDAASRDFGVDRATILRWEKGYTTLPGRLLELACKGLDLERRESEGAE